LIEERTNKNTQKKANNAWNAVTKKVKESVVRGKTANAQVALKEALKTMSDKNCNDILEQAIAFFHTMEKLESNLEFDLDIVKTYTEFEIMEINISKNLQHLQTLDGANTECMKNIRTTVDREDINRRIQIHTELMNTLNAHKDRLKDSIGLFENGTIPYLDDLEFENASDELKVKSLLLLNEILDTYVPSIHRRNEIDKEFLSWQTKELT